MSQSRMNTAKDSQFKTSKNGGKKLSEAADDQHTFIGSGFHHSWAVLFIALWANTGLAAQHIHMLDVAHLPLLRHWTKDFASISFMNHSSEEYIPLHWWLMEYVWFFPLGHPFH